MFGTGRGRGVDVRILGTPVRLEWSFFLIITILGIQFAPQPAYRAPGPAYLAAWIVLVTIGILVHEGGHVAALRSFGSPSRVVLAWVGGATIPESRRDLRGVPSIIVSLAGPAAGMTLAFIVDALIGSPDTQFQMWLRHYSWFVNFWWSIFNLLPILPLDGGHVIRELFEMASPRHGRNLASVSSIAIVVVGVWWIFRQGFGSVFVVVIAMVFIGIALAFMTITPRQRRTQELEEAHQMILDGNRREGSDQILAALGTPDDDLVGTEAYTVTAWALLEDGRFDQLSWLDPQRFHPSHRPLLEGAVVWFQGRLPAACTLVADGLGSHSVEPPASYFRRTFGRLGEVDALAGAIDRLPPAERTRGYERLRNALSVATG